MLRLLSIVGLCLVLSACSLAGGTLGGRQKCWGSNDPRVASLMRGTLELDPADSILATPEGESIPITFVGLSVSTAHGELVVATPAGATVAADGDLVSVFGGLGSDGSMVVCNIE